MGFERIEINNQRNGIQGAWKMPTNFREKVRIVKYWLKIVHRELGLSGQKIYKIMLPTITADNTIVKWAALVRDMLFNWGFYAINTFNNGLLQ